MDEERSKIELIDFLRHNDCCCFVSRQQNETPTHTQHSQAYSHLVKHSCHIHIFKENEIC